MKSKNFITLLDIPKEDLKQLILRAIELKKMNRIESNKKIYKILDKELKKFIHSIQILIS